MLKVLSERFSNLVSANVRSISLGASRFLKSEDKTTDSSSSSSSNTKLVLTEDLPQIPPNLGFPGDENVRTIFEKRRISKSFKYGVPPFLIRKNNPGPVIIRLLPITHCRNRHFYRIAVTRSNYEKKDGYIEDLGSIDPLPNRENKILIALNVERIKYYLGKQVPVKGVVGEILGLSGLLPTHPRTYLKAYRNRQTLEKQAAELKQALDEAAQKQAAAKTATA